MTREEQIAELEAYYREKGLPNAKALSVAHADKPLARLQGNTAPILARLMAGEKPQEVASTYGISREALNAWLLTHCAEEWRAISAGKSLAKLQDAEEALDAAGDMVSVSKSREQGKLATWNLERMIPHLYAAKNGQGDGGINITVNVNRESPETGITIEQDKG